MNGFLKRAGDGCDITPMRAPDEHYISLSRCPGKVTERLPLQTTLRLPCSDCIKKFDSCPRRGAII
jgi:hypothetical protein